MDEQLETISKDSCLRDIAALFSHHLKYSSKGVQVLDDKGNIVNHWTAIQIPDWAIRQKLDNIAEALKVV